MARKSGVLKELMYQASLRRWARAARLAGASDLALLRAQRAKARRLKAHLDKLIHVAESRLALPMIGSTAFPKPFDADWAWRPEMWRGPLPVPGISSVRAAARSAARLKRSV